MRSILFAFAFCIAVVVVHGTVTQTLPVEDATVRGGIYGNTNYGLEPTAYVRSDSADNTRWYFIKFPINNLVPIGNSRVVIRLFGYYQGLGFPLTVAAWSVPDDTWTQTTITFNNKPAVDALLSSEQVAHPIAWYEWDVTTYVRTQINLGATVTSFAFIASNSTADMMLINSLEADVSKPLLVVVAATPTQTVINPTDDSFVRGGSFANTNYGLNDELVVRNGINNEATRRAFLKFPLDNLIPITTQTVVLRLYGNYGGLLFTILDCRSVADNSWTQTSITWNNQPATGSIVAQSLIFTSDAWVEFDVTNYVKARQLASASSISFAILGDYLTLFSSFFNSLEAGFNQPELGIVPVWPTVSTVTPLEDASVRGGANCNTNYALDATAYVRTASTADNTWQYYVKFPLSNLATLAPGQTYKVRLFGYFEGTTLTVSSNAVDDNSWSQGTITFCNKPGTNGLLSSTAIAHPIAWYEFDVTSYVSSRKAANYATVSFAFLGTTVSAERFLINSLESDVNRPQLTIV